MQTYSGGAPPPKLGNALSAAGVVTRPIYGATEFGAPAHWVPSDGERMNGEWQWIRFCDNVEIKMVPQGDGTYELCVLVRIYFRFRTLCNNPQYSGARRTISMCITCLTMLAMLHLISSRSTQRRKACGRCMYSIILIRMFLTKILTRVGRKDDVIVHTTGEKTVPGPLEDIISSHPR